jgi:hypothetical protein
MPFHWRQYLKIHPAAELFPHVSADDLRVLVDDIAANGLRTKITLWSPATDKHEELLDGRHRLDALAHLGLLCLDSRGHLAINKSWSERRKEWVVMPAKSGKPFLGRVPTDTVTGDPYALALSYNVHRRHLSTEQKHDLIKEVLKAKPELSDRQIGAMTAADKNTVAADRADLEARGEIHHVEKRTDSKGRQQPAKKTKTKQAKPTTSTDTSKAAELASAAQAPTKTAPKVAVAPKASALRAFDADVLNLVGWAAKNPVDHFFNTRIKADDLAKLGEFFSALASLKSGEAVS